MLGIADSCISFGGPNLRRLGPRHLWLALVPSRSHPAGGRRPQDLQSELPPRVRKPEARSGRAVEAGREPGVGSKRGASGTISISRRLSWHWTIFFWELAPTNTLLRGFVGLPALTQVETCPRLSWNRVLAQSEHISLLSNRILLLLTLADWKFRRLV